MDSDLYRIKKSQVRDCLVRYHTTGYKTKKQSIKQNLNKHRGETSEEGKKKSFPLQTK